MVEAELLDIGRLEQRAVEEGLTLALPELRRVAGEIESGRAFEAWELSEIGKEIELKSNPPADE